MKNKERSIWAEILIGLLVNIAVVILLKVVSYIWDAMQWQNIHLNYLLGAIIVLHWIGIFIYIIWRKKSYKSCYYPRKRTKYDYIFEKNIIDYTLVKSNNGKGNDTELHLSRKVEVLSKRNGLDGIPDKYVWTGRKEAKLPTGGKNIRAIIERKDKPGVWKYLHIYFNKPIDENESINIEYDWPTLTDYKSSSPFVSASSDIPTKLLEFNLNFGSEHAGKKVYLVVRRSMDGANILYQEEYSLDDKGQQTIPIKPQRFRYYMVFWTW
ncbi:MAG: hypothetical protein J1F66_04150 [Clostridiales bacterium]|nr:hypothetical protein [Clostridiales bacterium]